MATTEQARDVVELKTGVCGIGFFVVLVAGVVLVGGTGVTERALERGAWDAVAAGMAENGGRFILAMWVFLLAHVLGIGFAVGLDRLVRWPSARYGSIALGVGMMLLMAETLLQIGVVRGLAPAYAGGGGEAVVGPVFVALLVVRNHAAVLAGALVAVAVGSYGRALLRSPGRPRLGYAAWGLAAVNVLGVLALLAPPLTYVRTAGIGLFALWAAAVGIVALRGGFGQPVPADAVSAR